MKYLIAFTVLLATITVTSCKKDGSSPNNNNNDTTANNHNNTDTIPGIIAVEINGILDSFNTNAAAVGTLESGVYSIHVSGNNNGIGVNFAEVSYYINNGTPVGMGHYSSYDTNVGFFYQENAGTYQFQSIGGHNAIVGIDSVGVIVTSIDSTTTHRIVGTFSGLVIDVRGNGLPIIVDTLTNGSFDVPLNNN